MYKIKHLLIILTVLLLSSCMFINPKNKDLVMSEFYTEDYFNGAPSRIQVWDTTLYPEGHEFWTDIEEIMQEIQDTFQTDIKFFDDDTPLPLEKQSELYQLNFSAGSGTPFKCSEDLYEVIKISIEYAQKTNGKLDPTIGPLVDLWDINKRNYQEVEIPSKSDIESLLPIIDYRLIELNNEEKTVLLKEEGMKLNLGAISKGYAADKIHEYLKKNNIKHAIINLGGNVYALGNKYDKSKWNIALANPFINYSLESDNSDLNNSFSSTSTLSYFGIVSVIDKTVVTSGIYERYVIDIDTGKRYSHILDPDTGYSVDNNLISVTIIASNSALADALSTSTFALGLYDGLKLVETLENVEAIFLTKDKKVYTTSGIDQYDFRLSIDDISLENVNEHL
ncbi:MAG TPA: FAD:protein FMN transferase [Haloplasmataceae bacterium]